MKKINKYIVPLLIAAILLFGVIQLVPFGRDHNNPPIESEPNWSSAEARALVKEQCFECHSNETEWPWYSNIAPASWLVAYDVIEGREHLNFSIWSEWDGADQEELDEIIEVVQDGEMPPIQYKIFYSNTRLNDQEKQALISALETSIR